MARQRGFVMGVLALALALSACSSGAPKGGGPVKTLVDHPLKIKVDSETVSPAGVVTEQGVNAERLSARPLQKIKWRLDTGDNEERRFQVCFIADDNPIHPDTPRCYRAKSEDNDKKKKIVIESISKAALGINEPTKEFKYEVQIICKDGVSYGNCGRELDPVIIVEK